MTCPWLRVNDDVSFPEPTLDAPPMPSQQRSKRGPVHARLAERDAHELWVVLRTFRAQYGEAALRRVLEESKR